MRRPALPRSRGALKRKMIVLCGAAICLTYISIILWMFAQRPVTSEDDERIEDGVRRGKQWQWAPPYVLDETTAAGVVDMTLDRLLSLFRLRIFVPLVLSVPRACTEQTPIFSIQEHAPVLLSLLNANYDDRLLPIDVDLTVFVVAEGAEANSEGGPCVSVAIDQVRAELRHFLWRHGRVTMQLRTVESGDAIATTLLAQSWTPSSDWELGLFVDHHALISPFWFQWAQRALRRYLYAVPDDGNTFRLSTEPPTPAPMTASWRQTPEPTSDALTPSIGVVVHPFAQQPLACVVLPQTFSVDTAAGGSIREATAALTVAVPSLFGVVWSAHTWVGFLAWRRAHMLAPASLDEMLQSMHTYMAKPNGAGRCVEGFLMQSQSLYQHPQVAMHVARLLGTWGFAVNITREQFEKRWCGLPRLPVSPFSSA